MSETYLSLGSRADWHVYVPMGALIIAVMFVIRRISEKTPNPIVWGMVGWGLLLVVGSLAGLPQSVLGGTMPFFYAAAMLTPWRTNAPSTLVRVGGFIALLTLGWLTCSIEIGRERVVLGIDRATYRETSAGPVRSVSRDALHVTAYRNVRKDPPAQFGWMVERTDHRGGLYMRGQDLYWGPHGLTSGDKVAKRIAAWAGVQPQYDIYSD